MQCGSRLSPITKRGKCCFSSTHTLKPCLCSRADATEPDGPAPMMATSNWVDMVKLLSLINGWAKRRYYRVLWGSLKTGEWVGIMRKLCFQAAFYWLNSTLWFVRFSAEDTVFQKVFQQVCCRALAPIFRHSSCVGYLLAMSSSAKKIIGAVLDKQSC